MASVALGAAAIAGAFSSFLARKLELHEEKFPLFGAAIHSTQMSP